MGFRWKLWWCSRWKKYEQLMTTTHDTPRLPLRGTLISLIVSSQYSWQEELGLLLCSWIWTATWFKTTVITKQWLIKKCAWNLDNKMIVFTFFGNKSLPVYFRLASNLWQSSCSVSLSAGIAGLHLDEFTVVTEIHYICTIKYNCHWLLSTSNKASVTQELKFKFQTTLRASCG